MEGLDFHKWELDQRVAALDAEVKFWRDQAATNNDFKRHSSQVRAFTRIVDDLRALINPTQENPVDSAADARERSRVVLGMFRIWQFLRGKLVQRTDSNFRKFLWLADEYAWLCYKPIYDAGLKEPPLVFLNGGYSPFTQTRKEGFEAESVPQELLQSQTLLDAMASLPFPVIGVPWYQTKGVAGLADLPVIGHEVGHSVEADLKLETPIKTAIDGAVQDAGRKPDWTSWASEVFADVYGCLGCGAAFASALASFLSSESASAGAGEYPPPALRFHFNLEVLRSLKDEAAASVLAAKWNDTYQVERDSAAYLADLRPVADAILDGVSAGGKTVRSLIPFEQDSRQVPVLMGKVTSLGTVGRGMPLRALVAAYRLAYDELLKSTAAAEMAKELPRLKRLEDAMMEIPTPDTRSGQAARTPQQLKAQAEAGKQSAALWVKQLRA
jgi:hypothetical protein